MNNNLREILFNALLLRYPHIRYLFCGLACIFLIGCGADLSGEYKNAKESVVFDPSDNTALIKTQVIGIDKTLQGNYKVQDNMLYIFSKTGESLGTFIINSNVLEAQKGSYLDSLMAVGSPISGPQLHAILIGQWGQKGISNIYQFANNNVVNLYSEGVKILSGTWEMTTDGEITMIFRISNGEIASKLYAWFDGATLEVADKKNGSRFELTKLQ